MISCDRGLDSMNAYNYYQKCKEAKNIDFSSITPHSTCNGINIILSIYLDEDSISSEGINYILYSVFKDKKGQLDWKAMESFREPGSGKTLGHIIAEYGDFSEIQEMFERYSKSNLIILHDTFDENIFHKLAQNSISDFYLKKYCAAVPALRELSSRVNIFNLTPAQVAVSKGNFSKAFSLYGCS